MLASHKFRKGGRRSSLDVLGGKQVLRGRMPRLLFGLSHRVSTLPIEALREPIVNWFGQGGVRNAVVRSPTGSGKSTQVPQMLLDHGIAGDKRIVVLQPRRIA